MGSQIPQVPPFVVDDLLPLATMQAIPRDLLRLAPFMPTRHSWLVAGGLIASGMAALLLSPTPVRAEVLYKLETTCTVKGGAPQALHG